MLNYYPLIGSKFAEVGAEGVSDEKESDTKRVARKLHIKAELDLPNLIKAGFSYVYDSAVKSPDGAATSGNYAHSATSGDRANSATSGYGAHSATETGNAIACAVGRKAKAKAAKGSFIVLAEWYEGASWADAYPLDVKSVKVDGKKIKANQWYKLVNGEFVETDDSNE